MKYREILEEAKNIKTELTFIARWERIKMFHEIGKLLLENEKVVSGKVINFATVLDISHLDIATAIKLADLYPNLDDLPVGKDISWSQIKGILDAQIKET